MKDLKNIIQEENKALLKLKLRIPWHKNMLYGLAVQASLQMMDLELWFTQDKNIWKKGLHVVDLILFLVSKLYLVYNNMFWI